VYGFSIDFGRVVLILYRFVHWFHWFCMDVLLILYEFLLISIYFVSILELIWSWLLHWFVLIVSWFVLLSYGFGF